MLLIGIYMLLIGIYMLIGIALFIHAMISDDEMGNRGCANMLLWFLGLMILGVFLGVLGAQR